MNFQFAKIKRAFKISLEETNEEWILESSYIENKENETIL